MYLHGDEAVEYLTQQTNIIDSSESSHWKKYHEDFKFIGEGFEGLKGFGNYEKPYKGLRKYLHSLFQKRYRRLAGSFKGFEYYNILTKNILLAQERAYNLDVLRQTLTVSLLNDYLKLPNKAISTACVIGDGFATMTSLLYGSKYFKNIILVNLNKTLLVDLWYLKKYLGEKYFNLNVKLVRSKEEINDIFSEHNNKGQIIAIQASYSHLLQYIESHLVINIASMQEMNPDVIKDYFSHIRKSIGSEGGYFYCCNRESKKLPDGTMVLFDSYPWNTADEILLDELCPWHQDYYTLRPPYIRSYDGPTRHKLIKITEI